MVWRALSWVLNVNCGLCSPLREPEFPFKTGCACTYTQMPATSHQSENTANLWLTNLPRLENASYNLEMLLMQTYSNLIFQTWQLEMYMSMGESKGPLPSKVWIVKAMVFPVVMYGYESWTIKKTEHRRIEAFELWCWIRLLRVPWAASRSNQSILKEINPEYLLEALMLKLKLQYFGNLLWRANSLAKNLILGKIWRQEDKGMTEDEMVGWPHWLNGHEFDQTLGEGASCLQCRNPRFEP